MRRDAAHDPLPGICPLPPQRSIKPYLVYELDAVRKQTKKYKPAHILILFSSIEKIVGYH